jgi:phosphatidylethanolamine-binding protein (PEBP) family uncharacterized protein
MIVPIPLQPAEAMPGSLKSRPKERAVFELRSSAFSGGDTVPIQFTCDGDDISPPLSWSGVPEGATELRLSLMDLDAPRGTFTHWLVTAIDPSSSDVGQGMVPAGGTEQRNSFGEEAYGLELTLDSQRES